MLCRHPSWSGRWSATVVLILMGSSGHLTAADDMLPATQVGWDGHIVLGSWTPLSADCDIADAGAYRLDVTATDPDGNLATFAGEDVACSAGSQRLSGRFLLGKTDGVVTATILREGKPWRQVSVPRVNDLQARQFRHTQAERLFVTVGLPDGVRQLFDRSGPGRRTLLHFADPSVLPNDDWAYDGVAGLFLAGPQLPSEAQAQAIVRWLRRGGRLIVSVGLKSAEFRASPLVKLLPVSIDPEPQSVRDLTPLESYAGKTSRIIPAGKPMLLPKFRFSAGRSLTSSRNDTALIQVPLGFGAATLLGLDISQAPLRDWTEGLPELLRRMCHTGEQAAAGGGRSQQLASTGISEMSSQMSAALEHFDSVSRTSPWWILGGLFAVMVLIGPLDYWLVARVTKRPLITWLTFPLLLALSVGAAVWAAGATNGERWLVNEVDVLDVDAATGFARGTHLLGVYSPESTAVAVQVKPVWNTWSQPAAEEIRQVFGWHGLPEASFGGMYRTGSGGLHLGEAQYTFSPQLAAVRDLPLAQWSTASLSSRVDAEMVNVVDSDLSSTATGRLSGTVSHRLPGPLTDWFLTYAGRIYRLPAKDQADAVVPLAPQQVFRVEQPSVLQRELRGYLTRTTAREVRQAKDKTIVLQQASYDSLSQDLLRILPILSFHSAVGGGGYTGLTNDMLAEHDLSPLTELDRACLFGYLEQPATDVTFADGIQPTIRRTTLVRLILPVDVSKRAIRELPKKDGEP